MKSYRVGDIAKWQVGRKVFLVKIKRFVTRYEVEIWGLKGALKAQVDIIDLF